MRSDATNMAGMTFGMLTVGNRLGMKHGHSEFLVTCSCGVVKPMLRVNILKSLSCGCVPRNQFYKHGMSETKLFKVWTGMNRRCTNVNRHDFERYGGRGISVCDEWKVEFEGFYLWAVAAGYREGLSIDRMDNNKGYSPENCKWSTPQEQATNRRSNIWISYDGFKLTASQWAVKLGLNAETIRSRYHRNWPAERILAKGV